MQVQRAGEMAAVAAAVRMIALDLDGTLLGTGGEVSERNRAALRTARATGIEVVIATGRRHCYAMRQLRGLQLDEDTTLVSSNGAVVRTVGAVLKERSEMTIDACRRLFGEMGEFRDALVVTFDRVGADGEDERGALVVEEMAGLHASIERWMVANEPYIERVTPIEDSLRAGAPIQMMLCGTVERMRRAETRLLAVEGVKGVEETAGEGVEITLHRTEYPARDLSILDILPAGASKGAALGRLSAARGYRMEQVMAIGDNWNDLPMLEAAGVPVLMGNAPEELLRKARERGWWVTRGNEEDGVAEAIAALLARGAVAARAEMASV